MVGNGLDWVRVFGYGLEMGERDYTWAQNQQQWSKHEWEWDKKESKQMGVGRQ